MVHTTAFEHIRKRLEAERVQLRADIDALTNDNQSQSADEGVGNHLADDATELFLRERNIALRSNAQELLVHVEAALQRLNAGNYGICGRCGHEINPERLDALPSATLCITCQSEVERGR